ARKPRSVPAVSRTSSRGMPAPAPPGRLAGGVPPLRRRSTVATAVKKKAAKKSSAKRTSTRKKPTDALDLLVADHRTVDDLFDRFEKLGDNATKTKRQVVDKIIK